MDEPEIKQEYEQPCATCLSIGRELSPLGIYTDIYSTITTKVECEISSPIHNMLICWECRTLLQKVIHFQRKAMRANDALILGQVGIYGTLSSLTSVTFNDTHLHTIYSEEQTDIRKIENYDNNKPKNISIDGYDDINDNLTDNDFRQNETEVLKEENEDQINIPKSKKIYPNRWLKAKKLENRKPKFKIVSLENKSSVTFKKVYIQIDEVKRRMKEERGSKWFKRKKLKCEDCVLSFQNETMMREHKKKHKKGLPYVCEICKTGFMMKQHLIVHIKRHFYKYQCTLCNYSRYNKRARYKHYLRHTQVQCLKCGLKFGARKDFKAHYKQWHEQFICDQCGICFKMRYSIIQHLRKVHSPSVCKICNKQFKKHRGLWMHNKTQHSTLTPAYCVECDLRFNDVTRYKWHVRSSAKHRPQKQVKIPCSEPSCDKTFSKITYMKDHYNLIHLKNYKYRCEECNKNFIRNAELTAHRRRVHEGILPPKNKMCNLCGRGFTTNKILEHHIRTHTGERPHRCACGSSFAQSAALNTHMRSRHHSTGVHARILDNKDNPFL